MVHRIRVWRRGAGTVGCPNGSCDCLTVALSPPAGSQGSLAHETLVVGQGLGGNALASIRPPALRGSFGGLLSTGGMTAVVVSLVGLCNGQPPLTHPTRQHCHPERSTRRVSTWLRGSVREGSLCGRGVQGRLGIRTDSAIGLSPAGREGTRAGVPRAPGAGGRPRLRRVTRSE